MSFSTVSFVKYSSLTSETAYMWIIFRLGMVPLLQNNVIVEEEDPDWSSLLNWYVAAYLYIFS